MSQASKKFARCSDHTEDGAGEKTIDMDGIRAWIEAEGSGHWFFIAFPVCLLVLLIWFKGRRVRFLIPSLLMTIVIINPVFYRVWDQMELYAYWRILWIVPVIPVLAAAIPSISEKIEKSWLKSVVAGAGAGLIVLGGTFLYNGAEGSFVEAANAAKLPEEVVQIADKLLELDDHPRVIAQDPVGVYIRQYSGQIDTLYGRDVWGNYIKFPSSEAILTHSILNNPEEDKTVVAQIMLNGGFDYLIYSDEVDSVFKLIDSMGEYGIYTVEGSPTVIKEKNRLGQIISITNVDEFGTPVNDEQGIGSIIYEYDRNGYISRVFAITVDGNGAIDEKGIAGFEREYDLKGRVLMEKALGEDGNPVMAYQSYAEIRREYKDDNIIRESYFDEAGNPSLQPAGYVSVIQEWDGEKLKSRIYVDNEGKKCTRVDGFCKVDWGGEEVELFSAKGRNVPLDGINLFTDLKCDLDGWSDWYSPLMNMTNYCITLDKVNLGEKEEGDIYSCQFEIEVKGITATEKKPFLFWTQGSVDEQWNKTNIWNNKLMCFDRPPEDGVYKFTYSCELDRDMADSGLYEIGFRCDNWASGAFRVRKIKIEKGPLSDWTPGL